MIRAYQYPQYANKGKTQTIKDILTEYRKTANKIAKYQWYLFFKDGRFNKNAKIKHIESKLSERYKRICAWQVVGVLNSFISNLQNKFKEIVLHSNLDTRTKRILLYINSRKEWFINKSNKVLWKEDKEQIEYEITNEDRRLAKKIFKHILRKWNKPRFNNISMHLNDMVAIIEKNKKSKHFNKWIKLSTLDKGNPIYIPLKDNTYAESINGELLNFCQIIEEDNGIKIVLVKEIKPNNEYKPLTDKIAIDLGLNPLIATDKGDLIGRKFLDILKKYDEKITKRMAYIQKKELKPSQDKKYRRLVNKLKGFLKVEINRYINRLVDLYKPSEIVIEKLSFRSPELSKRLNRIIQNFGKGIFRGKLNSLHEKYGIVITEINPAYTSQECSSCGYVDKDNRKDTQSFECRACGNKINAQINGAKNILKRASLFEIRTITPKKKVLDILIKRYIERFKGCNSAPLEVLKNNPYFKGFLNPESDGINFY